MYLIELVSVIGNSEFPRSEEFLRSEFRSEEFRNSEEFRSEFRLAASLLSCKVRDEERVLRDGFGTSWSFSVFDWKKYIILLKWGVHGIAYIVSRIHEVKKNISDKVTLKFQLNSSIGQIIATFTKGFKFSNQFGKDQI